MATKTIFGISCTENATTTLTSSLSGPRCCVFDSAGNLWIANYTNGTIQVIPISTGTLFGVSVTANTLTTVTTVTTNGPWGLAFDGTGSLYISNFGHNTIQVLPISTGTLFGVSVTANTLATLFTGAPLNGPANMAFDPSGNLYVANSGGSNIVVVPKFTGTLFGTSVTANTPIALSNATGLAQPRGITFDSSGNLYYSDFSNEGIYVLRAVSGSTTIFGHTGTQNTQQELFSGLTQAPRGIHFDTSGNLFFAGYSGNDAGVCATATGTILGVAVTQNQSSNVVTSGLSGPSDVTLDSAGDLFIVDFSSSNLIVVAATPAPAGSNSGFLEFV
jgi:sugar lactone lactonase YvrE